MFRLLIARTSGAEREERKRILNAGDQDLANWFRVLGTRVLTNTPEGHLTDSPQPSSALCPQRRNGYCPCRSCLGEVGDSAHGETARVHRHKVEKPGFHFGIAEVAEPVELVFSAHGDCWSTIDVLHYRRFAAAVWGSPRLLGIRLEDRVANI